MARDIIVDVDVGSPNGAIIGGNIQTGAYSTFEIVETVTGEAGTEAKAENLGTKTAVKLKLTIPRGGKGDQGESAYEAAKKEGYTGTKEEFGKEWASIKTSAQKVAEDAEAAFIAQTEAENARDDAAAHEQAAGESANTAIAKASEAFDSAREASTFAQAASEAKSAAETAGKNATESAEDAAVSEAEAKKAQAAAEKARDEAASIAGGDFASPAYVDSKAAEAENNANEYTDQKIAAIPTPDVSKQISEHNVSGESHNDMRLLIAGLTERLNVLANSDDTTLDQMAEVVEYIKDNRELIEQITTGKVSVSDIVDNLTTNVTNKPLSAAQGVALKALVEAAAAAAAAAQSTANGKATMAEVNAAISDAIKSIPIPDVSGQISQHNTNTSAHTDIRQAASAAATAAANAQSVASAAQTAANNKAPAIQYGTTDVTPGAASGYPEGTLYVVIE